MELIQILKNHTKWSIENIDTLFSTFKDDAWEIEVNGFPIWHQFYHMINSMDRIFIFTKEYVFPDFHNINLNSLDYKPTKVLSRNEVFSYYHKIKKEMLENIEHVDNNELLSMSKYDQVEATVLDLVLVQFRHMAFHIGYLHSCAKKVFGQTPDHILFDDYK